jgi:hypothetical protein
MEIVVATLKVIKESKAIEFRNLLEGEGFSMCDNHYMKVSKVENLFNAVDFNGKMWYIQSMEMVTKNKLEWVVS